MTEKQRRQAADDQEAQRERASAGPIPASDDRTPDNDTGDERKGDELARSVSDQELGPHQRKATPPAGTYEEPRPQTDPGWQDAGQRLANRMNDDLAEQREAQ